MVPHVPYVRDRKYNHIMRVDTIPQPIMQNPSIAMIQTLRQNKCSNFVCVSTLRPMTTSAAGTTTTEYKVAGTIPISLPLRAEMLLDTMLDGLTQRSLSFCFPPPFRASSPSFASYLSLSSLLFPLRSTFNLSLDTIYLGQLRSVTSYPLGLYAVSTQLVLRTGNCHIPLPQLALP